MKTGQIPVEKLVFDPPWRKPLLLRQGQVEQLRVTGFRLQHRRTIYQVIHPDVVASCNLTMGYILLEPASVWNTMPCHMHQRRIEVYLYFDAPKDAVVFHLMGTPNETRHIVARNEQGIISPSWSIYSGVGTACYSFVWAMVGENQTFTDMDTVAMGTLR